MLVILIQFVLRLAIGLALSLLCISPRVVDSGFYRIHMWILMGLFTLGGLATSAYPPQHRLTILTAISPTTSEPDHHSPTDTPTTVGGEESLPTMTVSSPTIGPTHVTLTGPIRRGARPWRPFLVATGLGGLALLSYLGGVLCLYERQRLGQRVLLFIATGGILSTVALDGWVGQPFTVYALRYGLDTVTSAGVLGLSVTAMLLGHWYLNSPGMQLSPLFRLIWLMLAAVALRAGVVAWGYLAAHATLSNLDLTTGLFVGLRWIAGLAGVALTGWMARLTLLIPNTQSATGILYVSVILAFLGELTQQLLAVHTRGIL